MNEDTVNFPALEPLIQDDVGYEALPTGLDPGRDFETPNYVIQEVVDDRLMSHLVTRLKGIEYLGSHPENQIGYQRNLSETAPETVVHGRVYKFGGQASREGYVKSGLTPKARHVARGGVRYVVMGSGGIGITSSRYTNPKRPGKSLKPRKGNAAYRISGGVFQKQNGFRTRSEFETVNELHGTVVKIDEEQGLFHAVFTKPGNDEKLSSALYLNILDDDQRASLRPGSFFYYVTGYRNIKKGERVVRRTPEVRFLLRKVVSPTEEELSAAEEEARWLLSAD